jgi:AhpD family alkylhydroperoxidase
MKEPDTMQARLDFYKASPDAVKALIALEVALAKLGLDRNCVDLVKLRASQINGCAYCIDLHTADLRKAGETDRRLATVSVWHDTPFFTERERRAGLDRSRDAGVADARARCRLRGAGARSSARPSRSNLTMAINAINSWNRLSIGFRKTLTA